MPRVFRHTFSFEKTTKEANQIICGKLSHRNGLEGLSQNLDHERPRAATEDSKGVRRATDETQYIYQIPALLEEIRRFK